MSTEPAKTIPQISWTGIWVALQGLGAAMRPLIESGNIPDWATTLSEAMDEAEPSVTERALAENVTDDE